MSGVFKALKDFQWSLQRRGGTLTGYGKMCIGGGRGCTCVGSRPLLRKHCTPCRESDVWGCTHREMNALWHPNSLMLPDSRNCTWQGYEKLGFRREGNATVYREWAPAASSAHLIGDFNSWGGTHMEKDSFGVWKVTLPDGAALASHMTHGSVLSAHKGGLSCCGTCQRIATPGRHDFCIKQRGNVDLCSAPRACLPCGMQILTASLPSRTDQG